MTGQNQWDLDAARAEIERLHARLALSERDRADERLRAAAGEEERRGLAAEISTVRRTLEESETRYRAIVESIVDYAIIGTDLSGRITIWTQPASEIFGWSAERMIGRAFSEIFTPDDIAADIPAKEMAVALAHGSARDERWHQREGAQRFFASGELMPLKADDGEVIGFLKILRDRTREEQQRRELDASRERLQFALDASALVGTWDWDVVNDRVYADLRFNSLYGIGEFSPDGLPFDRYVEGVFAEDRDGLRQAVEQAMADGSTFAREYRTINTDGKVRWIYSRGRCFLDAHGRPARFPGAVVDITLEKLRESRQAALLRLGDETASFGEPVDSTLKALQILGETLGILRVGYASVDPQETYATTLGEWTRPGCASLSGRQKLSDFGVGFIEALRQGLIVVEDVGSDGLTQEHASAWQEIGARSFVNMTVVEEGAVKVILYLHASSPREWTGEEISFIREILNRAWAFAQRRRAEQGLIEAERRLRLAQEAAEIGTFDYDLRSGELLWDERCRAAFGVGGSAAEKVDLETLVACLHPDDRARTLSLLEQALQPGSDGIFDAFYRTLRQEDGTIRHVHGSGQTVVEGGRTVRFVGAVRDVTEEKEAENRQILLTRELQHRVKNTLAMVNALANQTLRRAANVQEGLSAFSARLIALSHAHDILTQTSWTSAPVEAIVSQSLSSHQSGETQRISWSGPEVKLTAKQSLALALALHELATNAVKYGSLSNDEGRISIAWHIAMLDGAPTLHFAWREEGGPPVKAPAERGFGSRLIEQSLALEFGGTVALTYEPGGVVCTIDAKLQIDLDEDAILPLRIDEGF